MVESSGRNKTSPVGARGAEEKDGQASQSYSEEVRLVGFGRREELRPWLRQMRYFADLKGDLVWRDCFRQRRPPGRDLPLSGGEIA